MVPLHNGEHYREVAKLLTEHCIWEVRKYFLKM